MEIEHLGAGRQGGDLPNRALRELKRLAGQFQIAIILLVGGGRMTSIEEAILTIGTSSPRQPHIPPTKTARLAADAEKGREPTP